MLDTVNFTFPFSSLTSVPTRSSTKPCNWACILMKQDNQSMFLHQDILRIKNWCVCPMHLHLDYCRVNSFASGNWVQEVNMTHTQSKMSAWTPASKQIWCWCIVTCKCGLHLGSPIQTSTDGIASCLLGVLCSRCAPIRKVCPNLMSNECLRAYVIEVASLGIGLVELFQINWLSCLYCLSGWGYVSLSTFNVYWQDLDHKEQIS